MTDSDPRASHELTARLIDRFDRAQAGFKAIASAWTLSAIGAIGYLLLQSPTALATTTQFSQALLIFMVCLAANSGMFLLRFQDQGIYQKLLHSAFVYGLFLEYHNPDLPQINTLTLQRAQNNFAPLGLYYTVPTLLFTLFATIAGYVVVSAMWSWTNETWIVAIMGGLYIAAYLYLRRYFRDDLFRDYAAVLDATFADQIRDPAYRLGRLAQTDARGPMPEH